MAVSRRVRGIPKFLAEFEASGPVRGPQKLLAEVEGSIQSLSTKLPRQRTTKRTARFQGIESTQLLRRVNAKRP